MYMVLCVYSKIYIEKCSVFWYYKLIGIDFWLLIMFGM